MNRSADAKLPTKARQAGVGGVMAAEDQDDLAAEVERLTRENAYLAREVRYKHAALQSERAVLNSGFDLSDLPDLPDGPRSAEVS